ncbi:MAG: DUF1156 domain-containing protein [Chloroflexi bacterium]|nr:DUF1156 domain-containing protein [Chloroflexota bacterium]MCY3588233.1 DUF1156 domain-containing protein [Chloroflexota bacterium]MDE2708633.1 DUF1156 domain-containing protein [Chloroflexota bacterium]
MKVRRKLIEVALPLDAINKASAREKSIRHGHPSTLHLWWARRPLAAARAVIFAQMVDDPSANPDLFPTEAAQEKERQRLFKIIEDLVLWENTTNEVVLEQARQEIWQSWRRTCAENADHPRADELFNRDKLPAFHDPFAGGGSLPLEAQRLGLEAHASDLNPVAVLINKAMIEIPPKFAGKPPVNPDSRGEARLTDEIWRGAEGLAEDVRYYGQWMRDEAERRIGHLYPKVLVTKEIAADRPDLEPYVGRELTVIAWLWARTVKSPNPAFADVDVPLASTFILSKKKGKEAWVEPVIEGQDYRFEVRSGVPPESATRGTKVNRANFRCLLSAAPIAGDYIKQQGQSASIGSRLMAIVAEGDRRRLYLSPSQVHEDSARSAKPAWEPQVEISGSTQYLGVKPYGMKTFAELFTARQLTALTTLSDLVLAAKDRVHRDALTAGMVDEPEPLRGGGVGAGAYAEAVAVYLAFALDKGANYWSAVCAWHNGAEKLVSTFGRQAIPIVWDFTEANPFSNSSGNLLLGVSQAAELLDAVGLGRSGSTQQSDAAVQTISQGKVVATDPPYYDNVPYADLSDFFYVWLRRALDASYPELFSTVATPKASELVAFAHRHSNDKKEARSFFLKGMGKALSAIRENQHPSVPVSIFYAFRQSEEKTNEGVASTGWETFLAAVIATGFAIQGTWPVRTEYTGNLKVNRSALASSIVLVCRPRDSGASTATRREFQDRLRSEFPLALVHLQHSNIAPVDLAQASIGPGMRIFTGYREVLNADGSQMTVREALALINATLDEVLAEQEGDFDADSRWALTWFEQHGFDEGEFGDAEQLSKAKNTSPDGLVQAGVIESRRRKVRLYRPSELAEDWDAASDSRLTVWEMTHHLIRLLESGGEEDAAELAASLGAQAETARDLAYRLYVVSDRKRRAEDARQYNALVQSWSEIMRLAQLPSTTARQAGLEFAEE